MTKETKDLQVVAEGHIKTIENQILKLQEDGELDLPPNYSASNALRSAYLILQETVDKNDQPALEVCTKTSIANALMNMVTQGLTPAKNQGYFMVYGGKLVFMRSYFGAETSAKRVDPSIADIVAEPVYAGDTITYSIINGKKVIKEHLQTLDSVDAGKVKAAYAMTINGEGEVTRTTLMTFKEIQASWKQSKTYPVNDKGEIKKGSTHDKFTGEMVRRTVINRLCKEIINSSNDADLKRAIAVADQMNTEQVVEAEIDEKANKIPVDIGAADVTIPASEEPLDAEAVSILEKEDDFPETESAIDTALRTAEIEKKENKSIAEFAAYLKTAAKKGELKAVSDNLEKEYTGKFSKNVQDKVRVLCDEMMAAEKGSTGREF